jgi:hypothetical protein
MSKRVTTIGYIVSWIVAVVALVVFLKTAHVTSSAGYVAAFGTSPPSVLAWFVAALAGLVMLALWIGALVALGRALAWGWFVAVLVLQLIGLGIVGMLAYAIAGPGEIMSETPVRPSFT